MKNILKSPPLGRKRLLKLLLFTFFSVISSYAQNEISIKGKIVDSKNLPLPGATINVKGTSESTTTDFDGKFTISSPSNGTLVVSFIGFKNKEIAVDGKTTITIDLAEEVSALDEIIVVGYSKQNKKSITGAISSINADDIDRVHAGATVGAALAGKMAGVSYRMADGRPGASASIQIRNMGRPMYVIDGIEQDEGTFNQISQNDIESISILKDAAAAVYGIKAGNGVVVVTTKKGKRNTKPTVNINAYTGQQNWTNFMEADNSSYNWMLAKADAQMNQSGSTEITKEELQKYKEGTLEGYKSFDWKDYIVKGDAPLSSVSVSTTGGSEKINFYIGATSLKQESVLGDQFNFDRKNIQSNIDANITDHLKIGIQINGRIEHTLNPGIPGADDYWLPRFAIGRNRPFERPYANDNPEYLNDIRHNETNFALHNYKIGGYMENYWRSMGYNANAEYTFSGVLKGLKAVGRYSYYLADQVMNGHEYTYEAYTYHADDDSYEVTGGSTNPWRERRTRKVMRDIFQVSLEYKKSIGDNNFEFLFLNERQDQQDQEQWVHAVPATNTLPLIYFTDMDTYDDRDDQQAKVGYVGRINYNYKNKYFLESSIRHDATWKFAPEKRSGLFPGISAGWRVTEEQFMKNLLGENSVLNEFKIRGSYAILGDDDIGIGPYDYLPGYNYGGTPVILDGKPVVPASDKGQIVDNLTWYENHISNIGVDFYLFDSKLSGTFEAFKRTREGLKGRKYDVLIPNELGYSLPEENVNSDEVFGWETSLGYKDNIGDFTYNVSGNFTLSRTEFLDSYKPRFAGAYQEYRDSGEHRYQNLFWGYTAIGQFQSQEEINNYAINNDGRGNSTMLPGDIKYKDINGDGKIDWYDETVIGHTNGQPLINFGFSISLAYKGFDFTSDFSGASGYSWNQSWETRVPFQNEGALNTILEDRWHRADPFDLNSEWIPGKYPALRFNDGGHSNYNKNSTFWLHNVTYLRARTIELGYSLPKGILNKINMTKARFYINAYNLFTVDNLGEFGVDPEIADENGLQYPQAKFVNLGVNLSL
jgi:TonB-linked SusC/RagA family outer membrane protein